MAIPKDSVEILFAIAFVATGYIYEGFNGIIIGSILAILLLGGGVRAAAPVSPPESCFVWEPGENLTFIWTNENFDGFYYDAQSRAGKVSNFACGMV